MTGVATTPPRREQALTYIIERIVREGISPTNQEIGDALGVGETRAKKLVKELVDRNVLRRTPGSQRGLQIVDIKHSRHLVVERLRAMGMIVVDEHYEEERACRQQHLPILPPFRYLPDNN